MGASHCTLRALTALLLLVLMPAVAWAADPVRCAQLKQRLAELQAELRSDEARLPAGTADQNETRMATLQYDQRRISQIEVQLSAEGCPDAKPLVDAPPAIGGGGAVGSTGATTGTTSTAGTGAGGSAPYFNGDYDTHSELGLLHLELDNVNAMNWGFYAVGDNHYGPAIPCPDPNSPGKVYRGYLLPNAGFPKVTDYSRCEGICVLACINSDGILHGKYIEKMPGSALRQGTFFVGKFTIAPKAPQEKFFRGSYSLTRDQPGRPWTIERK